MVVAKLSLSPLYVDYSDIDRYSMQMVTDSVTYYGNIKYNPAYKAPDSHIVFTDKV